MLDRFFKLSEHNTTVRTELLAGGTTFLTMAYIVFLQPAILSGSGMDFGAVMTATCVSAALATAIMGLLARYPIAQAPGMGENFFFLTVCTAAAALPAVKLEKTTEAWQVALGVVFIAGVLFLILSLLGIQRKLLETISPSLRNAIAVGIGIFIAFIGLKNAGLLKASEGTFVTLNPQFASPDVLVFFFGLFLTAALHARKVRGSIVLGILGATLLAITLKLALPLAEKWSAPNAPVAAADQDETPPAEKPKSKLEKDFKIAEAVVAAPQPVLGKTLFKMDLINALAPTMLPLILIFLFMDVFDTLGTLVGVSEQAGLVDKQGQLPRLREAMVADAVGTVAGAAMGTSTVTSYIESTAGVEQGGRTGLTALTTAALFLVALFFYPIVQMVGGYPPITAPALVIVGSMMMWNVTKIEWKDFTEALPAFLIIIGIPLTWSIADGLALGFVAYPIVKLLSGKGREVKWLMYLLAAILAVYFIVLRGQAG